MLDCLFIVAYLLLLTDFQGYNLFSEEAKQTNSFIVQCLFYCRLVLILFETIRYSYYHPVSNDFTKPWRARTQLLNGVYPSLQRDSPSRYLYSTVRF